MAKICLKGSAMLNPVPSVLITSKSKEDKVNVFTVGWIGTACTHPPMITVAIRPERLSYEYIKETMEFTVNIPTASMVKMVDFCGVKSGRNVDKIKEMNFKLVNGVNVKSPMLDECPIALECRVASITPLGTHHLFLAEVVSVHIDESIMDSNGKFHLEKADLLCYSHGEYFKLKEKPLGKFGFSVQKKRHNK